MDDDGKILVALITAGLALIGTIFTAWMARLNRIEQDRYKSAADRMTTRLNAQLTAERDLLLERREAEKVMSKFRGPLLHAAYDLQSRIYNILKRNFLPVYWTDGTAREQQYAIENTVFLVAQFLGWTELIRREIHFMELQSDELTRRARTLQDALYTEFQEDDYGPGFRLFAGEQRAVGELMIDDSGPAPRCMGFSTFLTSRKPPIDVWLDPLREDVKAMAVSTAPFVERLTKMQHALIDLLDLLDSDCVLFPKKSRSKIGVPAGP